MNDKYKLLAVINSEPKLVELSDAAERDGIVHTVGCCANGDRALGVMRVYDPDIVVAGADNVKSGLDFAEKAMREGFDGLLIFYGNCRELDDICRALPRGGCAYIQRTSDLARDVEFFKRSIAAAAHFKKVRAAIDSIYLGSPNINRAYFYGLLTGEEQEYLRMQMSVLDVRLPQSGCVVYGKSFEPLRTDTVEKFASLIVAESGTVGDAWRDCCLYVSPETDSRALKERIKALLESLSADEFAVGLCGYVGEAQIKSAVKTAKSLVNDNILSHSCGVYSDEDNVIPNNGKCRRLVNDAVKLICDHYSEKISAEWAAKQLFVSSSYLMHEFKRTLGSTFNECLKKYRIMRAKEMLNSGNFRVNEVARAVGFSDARYFGMVFKNQTGISPGEYIKQMTDNEKDKKRD